MAAILHDLYVELKWRMSQMQAAQCRTAIFPWSPKCSKHPFRLLKFLTQGDTMSRKRMVDSPTRSPARSPSEWHC